MWSIRAAGKGYYSLLTLVIISQTQSELPLWGAAAFTVFTHSVLWTNTQKHSWGANLSIGVLTTEFCNSKHNRIHAAICLQEAEGHGVFTEYKANLSLQTQLKNRKEKRNLHPKSLLLETSKMMNFGAMRKTTVYATILLFLSCIQY